MNKLYHYEQLKLMFDKLLPLGMTTLTTQAIDRTITVTPIISRNGPIIIIAFLSLSSGYVLTCSKNETARKHDRKLKKF